MEWERPLLQGFWQTNRKSIFVVPQRAYMVTGSLLDQMIYPHSYPEFLESGTTLDDMMEILEKVHLEYLPEREGGWTTRKEWRDVLSGGEKQRVCEILAFKGEECIHRYQNRWQWLACSITNQSMRF